MTGFVRESPCESGATPNNKRITANKTSNSVSTNQSAGNPKTFPIVENRGYANEQPNAMVIHTIDLISVIFFMRPYLIELICGSDMNMMLNHYFCVFVSQYSKLY